MSITVKFKNVDLLKTAFVVEYHDILCSLMAWTAVRVEEFCITSLYRPDDTGVHGTTPCRGVDISVKNISNPQKFVDEANRIWTYDPDRPEKKCFILHDVGFGLHIHMQVCDETWFNR
jgi:hypothetical protein